MLQTCHLSRFVSPAALDREHIGIVRENRLSKTRLALSGKAWSTFVLFFFYRKRVGDGRRESARGRLKEAKLTCLG